MVSAMENAHLEPVVIEDLVKLGEDRGMRKGMRRGKQQGLQEGKRQGLQEGKQQGLQEGKRQGLQEGTQQGRLSEERDVVRRVLALRKLPLTPEQQERIDTCEDLETLRRWLDQAIFADSAAAALR